MKKFLSLEIGPNYQLDDAKIAFKSIFNLQKADELWATNWFKDKFATPQVWFFDTCRAGIYNILKSLNLNQGDEVLVQGFSCIVVPNAVLQAGLKAVICDVNTDNFNFDLDEIESKINAKTKAWIIQYNFGIVPDMQRVQAICEKYGLTLIEDCAHSLGAEFEIQGKKYQVGSFGHAVAFSFGRDKVISTTTGGAVIFNHHNTFQVRCNLEQAAQNMQTLYNSLEVMTSTQTLQNLWYAFLTPTLIKPLYQLGIGKLIAYTVVKLKLTGYIYNQAEKNLIVKSFPKPKKYSPKLFLLLNNQLAKLDFFNNHRREIVQIYASQLNLKFDPKNVYMRFPIYLKNLTKSDSVDYNQAVWSKILATNHADGYFLGKWYTKVFLGATVDDQNSYNYRVLELKNTATLIQNQVLNLPTNIDTTDKDAHKIISNLKQAIATV